MHDENTQGPHRESEIVIANPGTGKTTKIAERVASLLKEGVKPTDILCLTFTVKASEEMLSAIRKKCSVMGVDLRIANEVEVSTFHSFAYRQLREHEDFAKIINSSNLLRFSILRTIHRHNPFTYRRSYVISEMVPKLENAIRYVKSFGVLPDMVEEQKVLETGSKNPDYRSTKLSDSAFAKLVEFFLEAYRDYEKLKEGRFFDFNDLLLRYLDIPPSRRRKYPYIFVDELQDVNDIQARIIEEVGEVKFLVGDRKQSIFGFQGGTLSVFERFASDQTYVKKILGLNWRSTEQIINYAKEYFKHVTQNDIFREELENFTPSSENGQGDPPEVVISNNPVRTAANIASTLLESTDKEDKGTIAIITRTNAQLHEVSKYLDDSGVEYTNYSPPSASEEARNDVKIFLKGLLVDHEYEMIKALFTPFSGIGIAEAMKISSRYKSYKRDTESNNVMSVKPSDVKPAMRLKSILGTDLFKKMEPFFEMKRKLDDPGGLINVFRTRILPASVPMGRDYFLTVKVIFDSLGEIIRTNDPLDVDELLDFIEVVDINYDPSPGAGRIILTTVHKAKGKEFQHVVYVPSSNSKAPRMIDFVTNIIVLSTRGLDVSSELREEGNRVDFVAFTRAKKSLSIVIKEDYRRNYEFPNVCRSRVVDIDFGRPSISSAFSEAYSLFVAGKVSEALEALNDDGNWLLKEIRRHFSHLELVSPTSISAIKYPLNYLIEKIINVPTYNAALDFGTSVHSIAERLYYGEPLGKLNEREEAMVHNIQSLRKEIIEEGADQIYSEKKILLPLKDIFPDLKDVDSLQITGTIDAVFKFRKSGKYIILDYKTSKNERNDVDFNAQLYIYRKMFAKQQGIAEDDIDLALGYVALRGAIDTGDYHYRLKRIYPNSRTEAAIYEHIRTFIKFKKNPDSFVDYLIESTSPSNNFFENTSLSRAMEALLRKIYEKKNSRSGNDHNSLDPYF